MRRLSSMGYGSVSSYVSSRQLLSFGELIAELGPGDFAPVQLHEMLVEEAEQEGSIAVCGQYLLVRFLREVPNGWPQERTAEALAQARHALVKWQCALPERFWDGARQLALSMLRDQDIPAGWIPNGPNDEYLLPHLSAWLESEPVRRGDYE